MKFFKSSILLISLLAVCTGSISIAQSDARDIPKEMEPIQSWVLDVYLKKVPARPMKTIDGQLISHYVFNDISKSWNTYYEIAVQDIQLNSCANQIHAALRGIPEAIVTGLTYPKDSMYRSLSSLCSGPSRSNAELKHHYDLAIKFFDDFEYIVNETPVLVAQMQEEEAEKRRLAEEKRQRQLAANAERKRLAEEERQRQLAIQVEQERLARLAIEKEESERKKQIELKQEKERLISEEFTKAKAAFDDGQYTEAFEIVQPLAEQGFADAENLLGIMYAQGSGVPQDFDSAQHWYGLAVEQGHMKAQHNLGYLYLSGENVPQDYSEAMRLFQLAADQGFAPSQFLIGTMYAKGDGVTQSDGKAVKWLHEAATGGFDPAQALLGTAYEEGIGGLQDFEKAVYWYQMAAQQGNDAAQARLDELNKKLTQQAKEESRKIEAEAERVAAIRDAKAAQDEALRKAKAERVAQHRQAQAEQIEKNRRAEEEKQEAQRTRLEDQERRKALLSDLSTIFWWVLGIAGIALIIAGATDSVVIYFDVEDYMISLLALVLPLLAYGIFGWEPFDSGFFNGVIKWGLSPVVGIIGLGCVIYNFWNAIKFTQSIWLGLFVGVFKLAFPVLVLFVLMGVLGNATDKKNSFGARVGWFVVLILLAYFFSKLTDALINGPRVLQKKGWKLDESNVTS